MNPTPSKRRRSGSPAPGEGSGGSRRSASVATTNRNPTASPNNPILPPPLPSSSHGPAATGGHPFPPFAGPSNWTATSPWTSSQGSHRPHNVRHSMDMRSPTPLSPKEEDEMGQGLTFARDTSSRAPRSMMACTRCRRQKMKCDGPTQVPCRGCRQAGQACVFEARSRPKSISTLPSRGPLYSGTLLTTSGRPGTPSGPGFYPSGPQPAPPVTSRAPPEYALRQAREPMPPPPQASMTALTTVPYMSHRPISPPMPPNIPVAPYAPPPLHSQSTSSSNYDSRIRHLESSIASLSSVPASLNSLQAAIISLQRSFEGGRQDVVAPRARLVHAEIPDSVWENYRTRSWPLTPWLVGLRDAQGLPSLVVSLLGRRPLVDRSDVTRRDCDEALVAVTTEIGALVAQSTDWTREEIRSLGVYATWLNDAALATYTVGLARRQEHDRVNARKSQDDWREWIYVFILDHMIQLGDFNHPIANGQLASPWRDRLSTSVPGDPAVRDRDLKLLAWLEYVEMMRDIYQAQLGCKTTATTVPDVEDEPMSGSERGTDRPQTLERPTARNTSGNSAAGDPPSDRRKLMEIWRKYGSRWDVWASAWSVRNDSVLAIYLSYAELYTSSPSLMGSTTIWTDLSQTHDGYTQLERARDAAFALIQALCSPEIGRTLVYSFALYRPLLGLALHTVLSMLAAIPSSPLISLPHVTTVLRSTYEAIASARPLDMVPVNPSRPSVSLLAELVEGGSGVIVGIGKREVLGIEIGPGMWKRLLG